MPALRAWAWGLAKSCCVVGTLCSATVAFGQNFVPGSGEKIQDVGDDFEDPKWDYHVNLPKASSNLDGQDRLPAGDCTTWRIYESTYRGTPDIVKRVLAPEGGLPNSKTALLMRTLESGVPGQRSFALQQDDLMVNVNAKMGGFLPVAWRPSMVVRVYVPPFEYFEQRTGTSFGFRADVRGSGRIMEEGHGFFRHQERAEMEPFWPGMFIQFNCKKAGAQEDSAMILVRSNEQGQDYVGPKITGPGWWTLGMAFSPDGRVHYYAKKGVENLTPRDHIGSSYPYGNHCVQVETMFFNVCNRDDGRSWSTPWIIDDPEVYFIRPYNPGTAYRSGRFLR